MTRRYGLWPQSCWTSEKIDWKKSDVIKAGIDVGTTSTQAAIFTDDKLFGYANIRTGNDFRKAAADALARSFGESGLCANDINQIAATGFGRKNVSFASSVASEILCHAKGARFMFGPEITTVVDLGAQTCKAIRLYDWGAVRDFKTTDKCATGFGRSLEVMCELLQIPIEEIGDRSLDVEKDPEPVSTTCYSFASPETLGLLKPEFRGDTYGENEVIAAHLFTVAWRYLGNIGKLQPLEVGEVTVYKELAFTGGLAKNSGITKRLERELKVTSIKSEFDPQLAGAIGAALLA
jgi:CoA-substrate-specific enzyme activase, putative